MAKSRKKRRRKASTAAAQPDAASSHGISTKVIAIAVVALLAGGGLWYVLAGQREEAAFIEHAGQGRGALDDVERRVEAGSGHLSPGGRANYKSATPTSGVHDRVWIRPGVYDSVQPRAKLVHSVEHGLIVIYYDTPDAESWETLTSWTGLYTGAWSGIVLTLKPGLGEAVILTAWKKLLRLDRFDADAVAAFVDTYRGRGPENRVR